MNRLFLDALSGKNHSGKTPVWLMRQAGRYLVEYQELRKKYAFLDIAHTPELIVKVTEMPIDIFGFDAAIVFSDILIIAELLGFTVRFEEASGPHIDPVLSGRTDVERLAGRTIQDVPFLVEAIRELKKRLSVPLLGFAGAPFTLASYLIEGQSSQKMLKTKKWMLDDPESFHRLLDLLADYTIEYLNIQIDAGVDAIQIFDTWAEKLGWRQFQAFSARYMKKVMSGLKKCPVLLFCKGASAFFHDLAALRPDGLSLDWQGDLAAIRKQLGQCIALQGNLDPDVLLITPLVVQREVQAIQEKMQGDPGFIFNLGHGILPDTPRENVERLVTCLRS